MSLPTGPAAPSTRRPLISAEELQALLSDPSWPAVLQAPVTGLHPANISPSSAGEKLPADGSLPIL